MPVQRIPVRILAFVFLTCSLSTALHPVAERNTQNTRFVKRSCRLHSDAIRFADKSDAIYKDTQHALDQIEKVAAEINDSITKREVRPSHAIVADCCLLSRLGCE